MKDKFRGYYRPTVNEFKEMWRNGLFVVDTSVLLDLYRYSRTTRTQFIEILRTLGDQVWIPHQAAREYFRHRLGVLRKQKDDYSQLYNSLDKAKRSIEARMNEIHRDPGQEAEQLVQKVKEALDELTNHAQQLRDGAIVESNSPEDDEVLEFVTELSVGDPYPYEREQEVYKEGEDRYKNKVPPGYEDEGHKEGNEKFGDLLVWFQVLDKVEATRQPVILITDDRKEDWWQKVPKTDHSPESRIGPRPELVEEMHERADTAFYMYLPDRFMDQARDYSVQEVEVSEGAIDEVEELRERDEAEAEKKHRQIQEDLIAAWPDLTSDERVVSNLHYFHGRSAGQISESRNLSEEEVHKLLHSASEKIWERSSEESATSTETRRRPIDATGLPLDSPALTPGIDIETFRQAAGNLSSEQYFENLRQIAKNFPSERDMRTIEEIARLNRQRRDLGL